MLHPIVNLILKCFLPDIYLVEDILNITLWLYVLIIELITIGEILWSRSLCTIKALAK